MENKKVVVFVIMNLVTMKIKKHIFSPAKFTNVTVVAKNLKACLTLKAISVKNIKGIL